VVAPSPHRVQPRQRGRRSGSARRGANQRRLLEGRASFCGWRWQWETRWESGAPPPGRCWRRRRRANEGGRRVVRSALALSTTARPRVRAVARPRAASLHRRRPATAPPRCCQLTRLRCARAACDTEPACLDAWIAPAPAASATLARARARACALSHPRTQALALAHAHARAPAPSPTLRAARPHALSSAPSPSSSSSPPRQRALHCAPLPLPRPPPCARAPARRPPRRVRCCTVPSPHRRPRTRRLPAAAPHTVQHARAGRLRLRGRRRRRRRVCVPARPCEPALLAPRWVRPGSSSTSSFQVRSEISWRSPCSHVVPFPTPTAHLASQRRLSQLTPPAARDGTSPIRRASRHRNPHFATHTRLLPIVREAPRTAETSAVWSLPLEERRWSMARAM
jgi:hypothetical protein